MYVKNVSSAYCEFVMSNYFIVYSNLHYIVFEAHSAALKLFWYFIDFKLLCPLQMLDVSLEFAIWVSWQPLFDERLVFEVNNFVEPWHFDVKHQFMYMQDSLFAPLSVLHVKNIWQIDRLHRVCTLNSQQLEIKLCFLTHIFRGIKKSKCVLINLNFF